MLGPRISFHSRALNQAESPGGRVPAEECQPHFEYLLGCQSRAREPEQSELLIQIDIRLRRGKENQVGPKISHV